MRNNFHPNVGIAGISALGEQVHVFLWGCPQLTIHVSLKGEAVVGRGFRCVMEWDSPFLHSLALRHSPGNLSQSSVRPQSPVQQWKLSRWWMDPAWMPAWKGNQVSPVVLSSVRTLQTAPANTPPHLLLYLPLGNPSSGFPLFCIVVHLNCHSLWQAAGFSNAG